MINCSSKASIYKKTQHSEPRPNCISWACIPICFFWNGRSWIYRVTLLKVGHIVMRFIGERAKRTLHGETIAVFFSSRSTHASTTNCGCDTWSRECGGTHETAFRSPDVLSVILRAIASFYEWYFWRRPEAGTRFISSWLKRQTYVRRPPMHTQVDDSHKDRATRLNESTR